MNINSRNTNDNNNTNHNNNNNSNTSHIIKNIILIIMRILIIHKTNNKQ